MAKPNWKTLKAAATQQQSSVADFFMSAGIDYKGQAQLAYTTNGGGLSGNVSIDPGKIFGFKAEVGVGAAVTRANETLIVVTRGPAQLTDARGNSIANERPVSLSCLAGVQWEGQVEASLEAGIGLTIGTESTTKGNESKMEASVRNDPEEEEDTDTLLEIASAKIELKAGFKAKVSYKYSNLFAEDPLPLCFPPTEDPLEHTTESLKQCLTMICDDGTHKGALKKIVCDFINTNREYFGTVSYETWTGHTSSAKIIQILRAGVTKIEQTAARVARARRAAFLAQDYIALLDVFAGNAPQKGLCYLRLTSHNPKGEAALGASAEASASALGLASVSLSAEVSALSVSSSAKRARMRFQTISSPDPLLLCTQDTVITYSSHSFKALSATLGASASLAGHKKSKEKEIEPLLKKELNRMTYVSSIAYWKTPADLAREGKDRTQVNLEPGSGFAVGQSCVVKNLLDLIKSCYYDLESENVMQAVFASQSSLSLTLALAESLRITPFRFMQFICDPSVQEIIKDLPHQGADWEEKSVLVESTFGLKRTPTLEVKRTRTGKDTVCVLDPDALETLTAEPGELQSIRLRYRITELQDNDKTRFTLGFKILGTGAKISLLSVDRAGSEGIVDLATVWVGSELKRATNSKAAYEQAVPPVTLFCQ